MTLRQFDRYETLRILGEGAMGTVYEARDPRLQRRVAVKTIKPEIVQRDPAFLARFQREARTVAALNHPGIVAIYDCDADYLVMEFIEGRELKDLMGHGPQPPDRIAALLTQLAAALDFAHDRAIIHRDIKPANILVTNDGRVKLTDFGIAKSEGSAGVSGLTHTGQVLGTPAYMSPEQVAGKPLDRRSDQFSLAVVVYQLLTGEQPFTGDSIATLVYKIVAERHRPVRELNGTLPEGLDAVMDRALAKAPQSRYATCGEFARAFADLVAAQLASGRLPAVLPGTTVTLPLPASAPSAAVVPGARPAPRPVRPAPPRAPVTVPSAATQTPTTPRTRVVPATAATPGDRGGNRVFWLLLAGVLGLAATAGLGLRLLRLRRLAGLPVAAATPAPISGPASVAASASPAPADRDPVRSEPAASAAPTISEKAPDANVNAAPVARRPAAPPPPAGETARPSRPAAPATAPASVAQGEPEPASQQGPLSYQAREFKLGKRPGEPVSLFAMPVGFVVADSDDRKLYVYGEAGALLASLPREKAGGGFHLFRRRRAAVESDAGDPAAYAALRRPVAAAMADDKLFVADQSLAALLIFDDAGHELARASDFKEPALVAARAGEALVWDKDADAVVVLDAAGARKRTIANARSLLALGYGGGRVLAGNSDGLWQEQGGRFVPLLDAGDARIRSAAAIAPYRGGVAVADPDARKIHLLSGALKPAGAIDLEPLGVESPRLMMARGESLWVLHEHTKMTLLSPTP